MSETREQAIERIVEELSPAMDMDCSKDNCAICDEAKDAMRKSLLKAMSFERERIREKVKALGTNLTANRHFWKTSLDESVGEIIVNRVLAAIEGEDRDEPIREIRQDGC